MVRTRGVRFAVAVAVAVALALVFVVVQLPAPAALAGPVPPAGGPRALRVVPIEATGTVVPAAVVRAWRVRVAASLNRARSEAVGAAAADPAWFGPGDVAVYLVGPPGGPMQVVGIPAGAHIEADGSVGFPDAGAGSASSTGRAGVPGGARAAPRAGSSGPFSGPWGRERIDTWVLYDRDEGGLWCNTTTGEIRMHALRRRLEDRSRRYDYVGVAVRAVAEITEGADNCDDVIDWFSVGVWSPSRDAIWLDQDPVSGSSGACRDLQAGVSAGVTAVATGFATVSQTFRRCERWTVVNGLPVPPDASRHYDIRYERGGVTDNDQREAGLVAVVRLRQGARLDAHYGLGLGVGNQR